MKVKASDLFRARLFLGNNLVFYNSERFGLLSANFVAEAFRRLSVELTDSEEVPRFQLKISAVSQDSSDLLMHLKFDVINGLAFRNGENPKMISLNSRVIYDKQLSFYDAIHRGDIKQTYESLTGVFTERGKMVNSLKRDNALSSSSVSSVTPDVRQKHRDNLLKKIQELQVHKVQSTEGILYFGLPDGFDSGETFPRKGVSGYPMVITEKDLETLGFSEMQIGVINREYIPTVEENFITLSDTLISKGGSVTSVNHIRKYLNPISIMGTQVKAYCFLNLSNGVAINCSNFPLFSVNDYNHIGLSFPEYTGKDIPIGKKYYNGSQEGTNGK